MERYNGKVINVTFSSHAWKASYWLKLKVTLKMLMV